MRRAPLAALLLLLLCLPGCWSKVEVNDLGLVTAIAVDAGREKAVQLTLFYVRQGQPSPETKPVGGDPIGVASRESDNLSDAFSSLTLSIARTTSLHHAGLLLVGEEYARQGMKELLDFLARSRQVRLTLRPLVVRGRAHEILSTPPQLRALQPQNLLGILEAKHWDKWRLGTFLVARVSETHTGWMHVVEVIQRLVETPGLPPAGVVIRGVALFRGDRLVAVLPQQDNLTFHWMLGDPEKAVFSAPCPEDPNKSFSGVVSRGSARFEPTLGTQGLRIGLTLKGRVDLERVACKASLMSAAERGRLEKALEAAVVKQAERVVALFQEKRVDPVGFGKRVQLRYPAYFRTLTRDWTEVWPSVPVTVRAEITIHQAGVLIRPANLTDKELQGQ